MIKRYFELRLFLYVKLPPFPLFHLGWRGEKGLGDEG
jgi:hypothetical protein